jgi:hypothetical protein
LPATRGRHGIERLRGPRRRARQHARDAARHGRNQAGEHPERAEHQHLALRRPHAVGAMRADARDQHEAGKQRAAGDERDTDARPKPAGEITNGAVDHAVAFHLSIGRSTPG